MRTTIVVDDNIGERAQARARREGLSFSALVTRALEEHLARKPKRVDAPPFRLVTVGGGGPRPGIDLDRTSELLAAEDELAYGSSGGQRD
jgi:hypothetical protein